MKYIKLFEEKESEPTEKELFLKYYSSLYIRKDYNELTIWKAFEDEFIDKEDAIELISKWNTGYFGSGMWDMEMHKISEKLSTEKFSKEWFEIVSEDNIIIEVVKSALDNNRRLIDSQFSNTPQGTINISTYRGLDKINYKDEPFKLVFVTGNKYNDTVKVFQFYINEEFKFEIPLTDKLKNVGYRLRILALCNNLNNAKYKEARDEWKFVVDNIGDTVYKIKLLTYLPSFNKQNKVSADIMKTGFVDLWDEYPELKRSSRSGMWDMEMHKISEKLSTEIQLCGRCTQI